MNMFPPQGGYDQINGDKEHITGSAVDPNDVWMLVASRLGLMYEYAARMGYPKRQCVFVGTYGTGFPHGAMFPAERVVLIGRWFTGQQAPAIRTALTLMLDKQGQTIEDCIAA